MVIQIRGHTQGTLKGRMMAVSQSNLRLQFGSVKCCDSTSEVLSLIMVLCRRIATAIET